MELAHSIVKVAVRRALKFFEFDVNVNGLAAERLLLSRALFKPLFLSFTQGNILVTI